MWKIYSHTSNSHDKVAHFLMPNVVRSEVHLSELCCVRLGCISSHTSVPATFAWGRAECGGSSSNGIDAVWCACLPLSGYKTTRRNCSANRG